MVVDGIASVPGDKSITHRLLLLAGLASGQSRLRGALTSLDARSTARVLRALGVRVSPLRAGTPVTVAGRPRFRAPDHALDCGNSGTTARLVLGLLAAHPFRAVLTGDASLRRRPMRRVTEPLTLMGATFSAGDLDRLPLAVRGGRLRSLEWRLPVSSAQIKGSLLFAAMAGGVAVSLFEPGGRSRDHTERLLRSFGFGVVEDAAGWIRFSPGGALVPFDLDVPGDPSSAAFLVGAALLAEGGSLRVAGVGLNPTRTGFLRVLDRMGAAVRQESLGERCGEPVGDLVVRPGALQGTVVEAREIPGLIDEIPMLAVLAARARGETRFHQVGELRVKESDRLGLLVANLRAVGVAAAAEGDTLIVEGNGHPPRGRVRTEGDHRIAMAFAVLGTVAGARVRIDDLACASVSFPGFEQTLRALGRSRGRRLPARRRPRGPAVIAIDGPAASGKSTTATAVARALGVPHLDSGALYRALTVVALGTAPRSARNILKAAETRGLELRFQDGGVVPFLDGRDAEPLLRSADVTALVSEVSADPAIRKWVNARLREAVALLPLVVLDGRDIGTAVFPDAPVKIFLTATPEARARRRLLQQGTEPTAAVLAPEAERLAERDRQDSARKVAPLRRAPDAVLLDTTDLAFVDQVAEIVGIVNRGLPRD